MGEETDTPENRARVEAWIRESGSTYEDAFDMAVECANDLSILEMCEVHGDRTFIPMWIQQLTEKFFET